MVKILRFNNFATSWEKKHMMLWDMRCWEWFLASLGRRRQCWGKEDSKLTRLKIKRICEIFSPMACEFYIIVSFTSLWVLVKEIHRWWCWSHKKKKAEIKQEAFDRRWMFLTVLKKPVKGWCKLIVFHKNQLVCDSAIMS